MELIDFPKHVVGPLVAVLLLSVHSPATAQTDNELDSILPAYTRAMANYAQITNMIMDRNFTEEKYWADQYYFYRSKVYDILSTYTNAAQGNPQTYCLPALEAHNKVKEAENGKFIIDTNPNNLLEILNRINRLQSYCARFGIYFNPHDRRM